MLPLWMKETTGRQQKVVNCHFYFDMSFFSNFNPQLGISAGFTLKLKRLKPRVADFGGRQILGY